MSEGPAPQVVDVLRRGAFCHVASSTPRGPHVTPMVFAEAGGHVWVTTSRGSLKARAWRRDPRVAGLVRSSAGSVAFAGSVRTYDLLDPATWGHSISESPMLSIAALRFVRKNARFFAGYAADAHHVPLAWTPPGRVFAELRIERAALTLDGRLSGTWGTWGDRVGGAGRFRVVRAGADPLDRLPEEIRHDLGLGGQAAVALEGDEGLVVLPCAWTVDGAAIYAAIPAEVLALAGVDVAAPAALGVDHPSSWRARAMVGAMFRGRSEVTVGAELSSGAGSFERIARSAGVEPSGGALVRVRPSSVVWWRGWTSGTVGTP
ncbi:MAG: pyridoxamine 5'-phosphate oxidase family protein [Actinobacteria bacterium]|nr:pyridoxamine 5'-phosphate oxidase family protein [Actinomycetota bacterium]